MNRPFPWPWLLLLVLVLAPGFFGRVLLDLVGGLTLLVVVLAVAGTGAAILGARLLRNRLRTCPACGTATLAQDSCPMCGHLFSGDNEGLQPPPGGAASEATITVEAVAVQDSADQISS